MGLQDFLHKQSDKNAKMWGNYLTKKNAVKKSMNQMRSSPVDSLTPVQLINAVHKALLANGVKFSENKKHSRTLLNSVNEERPKGTQSGFHSIGNHVLMVTGTYSLTANSNIKVTSIFYVDSSENVKHVSRAEIESLLAPAPSMDAMMPMNVHHNIILENLRNL